MADTIVVRGQTGTGTTSLQYGNSGNGASAPIGIPETVGGWIIYIGEVLQPNVNATPNGIISGVVVASNSVPNGFTVSFTPAGSGAYSVTLGIPLQTTAAETLGWAEFPLVANVLDVYFCTAVTPPGETNIYPIYTVYGNAYLVVYPPSITATTLTCGQTAATLSLTLGSTDPINTQITLYQNGTPIYTGGSLSYALTGLVLGDSYSYYFVSAHTGLSSNTVTLSPFACPPDPWVPVVPPPCGDDWQQINQAPCG